MTTLIDRINEKFQSGNDVPVDSVRVTAEEWEQIRSFILSQDQGRDTESDFDFDRSSEAHAFVQKMVSQADGYNGVAPWWHGWALRESFIAGAKFQRERDQQPTPPEKERVQGVDDGWLWMRHPTRFGGKPIPVYVFTHNGTKLYRVGNPDSDADEYYWDDRDDEWEIVSSTDSDELAVQVHRAADKLFELDQIDGEAIRYDLLIAASRRLRIPSQPTQDRAPSLPEGFVAVPLEPTEEMKAAALRHEFFGKMENWRKDIVGAAFVLQLWDAMLAARPSLSAGDGNA